MLEVRVVSIYEGTVVKRRRLGGADILAALTGRDDLDLVAWRQWRFLACRGRHEIAIERRGHADTGEVQFADESRQRTRRGRVWLTIEDDFESATRLCCRIGSQVQLPGERCCANFLAQRRVWGLGALISMGRKGVNSISPQGRTRPEAPAPSDDQLQPLGCADMVSSRAMFARLA